MHMRSADHPPFWDQDLGLDAMRLLVEAVVAWGGEQNVEARRVQSFAFAMQCPVLKSITLEAGRVGGGAAG